MNLGFPEFTLIFFSLIWGGIKIIPYWKIFSKAGYSPFLSIFMVIPGVDLALLFYLGFTDWPSMKQREQ